MKIYNHKKEKIMNSLRVDDGFHLAILKDWSGYNASADISLDKYPSKFYEKAYDAIKALAKHELTPNHNGETFNLIYIENMYPLCQLFFWAVKNLQKEGEIPKDIKIVTQSVDYGGIPFEGKFSIENQKKINNMSDAVKVDTDIYRIKTPGDYRFSSLTDVFGAELTISEHIQYDETEDKFEMSY